MVEQLQSSDSEEQTNPRKRSRKSTSVEDANGSKKRGRPRVDTHDATAADRRRTQIRLAQRAYRQRKETTISSLKKRVSELEEAVAQMNQSFLRFNDSAMSAGIFTLRPQLAKELKATTEIFVRLARDTADKSTQDDDEVDVEEIESEAVAVPKPDAPLAAQPQTALISTEQDHLDMGWGYARMYQGREAELQQRDSISSFLSGLPNQTPQVFQRGHLPFGLIPHDQSDHSLQRFQVNHATVPSSQFPADLGDFSKDKHLTTDLTYSFQETTFARRLQRAAIERGYHLLSATTTRPDRFAHVFRLSLLTQTREQIAAKFRTLLVKSNLETLDFWQTPFIHMGGAGMHYPKRDMHGNIIPIPNSWTIRRIGPLPSKRALLSNSEGVVQDVELDLTPFEGEWFDPHDVQGYLEEKGCWIDPQASFAEALIDMHPTFDLNTTDGPLGMDLGMSNPPLTMPGTKRSQVGVTSKSNSGNSIPSMSSASLSGSEDNSPPTPNVSIEASTNDLNEPFSAIRSSENNFSNYEFNMGDGFNNTEGSGFFDLSFPNKSYKKRSVTVDVSKLVDELLDRCVCLGRAPGFRRNDVDAAFNASIISAF